MPKKKPLNWANSSTELYQKLMRMSFCNNYTIICAVCQRGPDKGNSHAYHRKVFVHLSRKLMLVCGSVTTLALPTEPPKVMGARLIESFWM
jgi:hypothetical protein